MVRSLDYITVKQAAEKWGLTIRAVQKMCTESRISGVIQPARDWLIPKDAERPADKRYKSNKQNIKKTKPDGDAGIMEEK